MCADAALSRPETCKESDTDTDCETDGYISGTYELPSRTCPSGCTLSRAGYPGTASVQCIDCMRRAGRNEDQLDSLLADVQAGNEVQTALHPCFPSDAVWGTRCSSTVDSPKVLDGDSSTHPSATCWMCVTKAGLDNPAGSISDWLARCTDRPNQRVAERVRLSKSQEQGLNRDAYCQDRVQADALAESMSYEDRCKDSACCHWDSGRCHATDRVSTMECPLQFAIDLNAKASSTAGTAIWALGLVTAGLVVVPM